MFDVPRNLRQLEIVRTQWRNRNTAGALDRESAWDQLVNYLVSTNVNSFQQWEEATQWYLAANAFERSFAWHSRNEVEVNEQLSGLRSRLMMCRRLLAFDQPTLNEVIPRRVFDSPRDFEPQQPELVRIALEIQKVVRDWDQRRGR